VNGHKFNYSGRNAFLITIESSPGETKGGMGE
jgi:hypothetical protein